MLCMFFSFFFLSCNLWSYCSMHYSVHKTKNRPMDLFDTDCINPNSVAIGPSLYEIFVFSFFLYGLWPHGHLFNISVFFSPRNENLNLLIRIKKKILELILIIVQNKNIAVIGYIVRFRHLSKCKPQMTLSTGNYYDVIFLPNDTDLHGKRTRIWEYINFIGHGFVGRHRFEERTRIWGCTWIWVLHI
jgi:hypothetical protein